MKSFKFAVVASCLLASVHSYTFSSNLYDTEPEESKVQVTLDKLPREFKQSVFSRLVTKDFIKLSHTSREWRQLAYFAGRSESINLSGRKLTNEDCYTLVQSPFSSLILSRCSLSGDNGAIIFQSSTAHKLINELNQKGVNILDAYKFRAIKKLDLSRNYLTAEYLPRFASAQFPFLKSLNLMSSYIKDEGVKLLAVTDLPKLKSLDLSRNGLTADSIKSIAFARFISNLTSLDLNANNIGAEGIEHLIKIPFSCNFTLLNLSGSNIGIKGIEFLIKAPFISTLTSLDLSANNIGAEGIRILIKAPFVPNLISLNLGATNIGAEEIGLLIGAPFISNLMLLNLDANNIGIEAMELLIRAPFVSNFTSLNSGKYKIKAEEIGQLTEASSVALTPLQLDCNKTKDEGVKYLAAACLRSNSNLLNLYRNPVEFERARHVILVRFSNLKSLDLSNNSNNSSSHNFLLLAN